ncbi:hypothetical protein EYF80_016935 [Liparis tanakae]|uniref:Uncharacterized protein n=1 Tax=Liparis tanakae TaxID=230148 RepID=A0A4Z2I676_9TELE|nr:hypothetical protein EYF80_016935 [Liparis tanakae]
MAQRREGNRIRHAEDGIPFGVSGVEVFARVLTKVVGAVVSGAHPRLQVGCRLASLGGSVDVSAGRGSRTQTGCSSANEQHLSPEAAIKTQHLKREVAPSTGWLLSCGHCSLFVLFV